MHSLFHGAPAHCCVGEIAGRVNKCHRPDRLPSPPPRESAFTQTEYEYHERSALDACTMPSKAVNKGEGCALISAHVVSAHAKKNLC